jgi:hypothetical protein
VTCKTSFHISCFVETFLCPLFCGCHFSKCLVFPFFPCQGILSLVHPSLGLFITIVVSGAIAVLVVASLLVTILDAVLFVVDSGLERKLH